MVEAGYSMGHTPYRGGLARSDCDASVRDRGHVKDDGWRRDSARAKTLIRVLGCESDVRVAMTSVEVELVVGV